MSTEADAEALAPAVEGLLFALVRGRLGEHEPSPFSTTQQLALAYIVDAGPLRLGALARAIGTSDPTASRAIDVLERAGLVDRRPDPTDGRGVIVAPTAKGRRAAAESRSRLVGMLARVLDTMTPGDRDRFVEAMHGVRALVAGATLDADEPRRKTPRGGGGPRLRSSTDARAAPARHASGGGTSGSTEPGSRVVGRG